MGNIFFLVIFIFATFNGIIILKTRSFSNPYKSRSVIQGLPAIVIGIILLLLGLGSLGVLIIGINKFLL